jgi:hypothetical protein
MDEAGKDTPPVLAETYWEGTGRTPPGRCCPREAPRPPGHVKVGKNDYMTRMKPESAQTLRGEKGQEGKGRKEKRGHLVYLYLLRVLCGAILEGK